MGNLNISILPESYAKFQKLKGRTSFILFVKLENNTSNPIPVSLSDFSVSADDKPLLLVTRANHPDRRIIGKDDRPTVVNLDLIQITSRGIIPEKQLYPNESINLTLMAHYRDNNYRFNSKSEVTLKFRNISISSPVPVF